MKKLLMAGVAALAACTTPEQAVKQSYAFCGIVAAETGNRLADHPVYAMECTERGARNKLASERGTLVNVASGLAITAAGIEAAK